MTSHYPGHVLRKYKLVFLGETSVGKTALLARFMYDQFDSTYHATIGIDFLAKNMFIDDQTIKLQLWDTADSNAAVVVYDITNRRSFDETNRWIDEVRVERANDVVIMLVGNKVDLGENRRQVAFEEGEAKAAELGAWFIETSAKSGFNVRELFRTIATRLAVPNSFYSSSTAVEDNPAKDQFSMKTDAVEPGKPENVILKPEVDKEKSSGCSC